jgi:hypothetical protein
MSRNTKYLNILLIIISIYHLSCAGETFQLNLISANNEGKYFNSEIFGQLKSTRFFTDIQLTTYNSGIVVTLEEKHFPLKIICKTRFPTAWKISKVCKMLYISGILISQNSF